MNVAYCSWLGKSIFNLCDLSSKPTGISSTRLCEALNKIMLGTLHYSLLNCSSVDVPGCGLSDHLLCSAACPPSLWGQRRKYFERTSCGFIHSVNTCCIEQPHDQAIRFYPRSNCEWGRVSALKELKFDQRISVWVNTLFTPHGNFLPLLIQKVPQEENPIKIFLSGYCVKMFILNIWNSVQRIFLS